jgi:hypothetical protein
VCPAIVDICQTTTTHYRVNLDNSTVVSQQTFNEAPVFFADGERIEGGIADQAFDLLRTFLESRSE